MRTYEMKCHLDPPSPPPPPHHQHHQQHPHYHQSHHQIGSTKILDEMSSQSPMNCVAKQIALVFYLIGSLHKSSFAIQSTCKHITTWFAVFPFNSLIESARKGSCMWTKVKDSSDNQRAGQIQCSRVIDSVSPGSHAIFALLRTPSLSLPVLTLISTSAQLSWRQSAPWRDPCHRVSQNRAFHLRTHPWAGQVSISVCKDQC